MISMSASIDAGDVARFENALKDYAEALGSNASTVPRRAAIQLCKSLRAASATRKAPKYARSSEYNITPCKWSGQFRVIVKNGRKYRIPWPPPQVKADSNVVLKRYTVDRPIRGVKFDVYAEKKSDIRKKHLLLARSGLARQSWGWVMNNIFNGSSPDTPWRRRKNDKRDPRDATRESSSSTFKSSTAQGGSARICNRLDYIADALKISVDVAVEKAANWMMKQVDLIHERKRRAF